MRKLLAALCLIAAPAMAAKGLDSARIEQITGLKGQWTEKEGVFKVQVPRTDLAVFLHYWGVGGTEDLARALASALKKTKVA